MPQTLTTINNIIIFPLTKACIMIHLQNMAILWRFFSLDSQDTLLVIGPLSTNQNGDNIRKEYFLAAQWINLEFFQIFGKDFPKYSVFI